jgi:protease-4
MILNVHEQFIQDIFKVREKKIKNGLEGLRQYAQGQIFSGQGAMERGLVDELAGLWEAGRRIHKELDLKGKFGLKEIKIKKDFSISDVLSGLEQSVQDFTFRARSNYIPLLIYK